MNKNEVFITFYNTQRLGEALSMLTQAGVGIGGARSFTYEKHVPPSRGVRQDTIPGQIGVVVRVSGLPSGMDRRLTQDFMAGAVTSGEFHPRQ